MKSHRLSKDSGQYYIRSQRIHRSAFTLVELVGLLLVISSIMSIVGMILHRSSRIQSLALQTVRLEKQLDDLRNSFIQDVERASRATIEAGTLQLQTETQRIEYKQDKETLLRTAFDADGKVVQQRYWSVDVFDFQPQLDATGKFKLVHFQIRSSLSPQTDSNKQNRSAKELDETNSRVIRWSNRLGGTFDVP